MWHFCQILDFVGWKSHFVIQLNLLNSYYAVANGFRLAKDYEKAKLAFEKASKGQEMLSSYPYSIWLCSLGHLVPSRVKMIMVVYNVYWFTLLKCRSLLSLTSDPDHGMQLSTWNLLLLWPRIWAIGKKSQISIEKQLNCTWSVGDHNLLQMLLQREPGK